MSNEIAQKENCLKLGRSHSFEFKIAAHGYQCWACTECGHTVDEVEDTQP